MRKATISLSTILSASFQSVEPAAFTASAFDDNPLAQAQGSQLEIGPQGSIYRGTAGALCQDGLGNAFLLTCGHVLLVGTTSMQGPANVFYNDRLVATSTRIVDIHPRSLGDTTPIDAALLQVDPVKAQYLRAAVPGLLPSGTRESEVLTGETLLLQTDRGVISARYVQPLAEVLLTTPGGGSYRLLAPYAYWTDTPSKAGDSGAAIWDNRNRLVGLHCGGVDGMPAYNAVFCAIRPILSRLQVSVVAASSGMQPAFQQSSVENAALAEASNQTGGTLGALGTTGTAAQWSEEEVLARTLYAEVGSMGDKAMRAVGAVVLNRRNFGKWMGKSVIEVCLKPYQFPCWDPGSVRNVMIRAERIDHVLTESEKVTLQLARSIANDLLQRENKRQEANWPPSQEENWTRYHPEWVYPKPDWAIGVEPAARIGGLLFYNRIDD